MGSSVGASGTTADPIRFVVGARITISVMSDRYIEVILSALKASDSSGLLVQTGDVSTYIGGSEPDILRYLVDLTSHVAASAGHASIAIHFFRGCPGAVVCESPPGPRVTDIPVSRCAGHWAAAEWALYPLVDDGGADHMRDIYAAIAYAERNGTFVKSERSVTRLEGDIGKILETVVAGWVQVGRTVQHVASHVTVSVNSPSHRERPVS